MRKRYVTEKQFEPLSKDENHYLLAKHLPKGIYLSAALRKDKDLGKLVYALAMEYHKLQILTKKYSDEYDIRKTVEVIEDWEKSVGLPFGCFTTIDQDIERRRQLVEGIFSNFKGVQTKQEFIDAAAFFGITVEIYPAIEVAIFPFTFPMTLSYGDRKEASSTIIVEADEEVEEVYFGGADFVFPLPLTYGYTGFLECLYDLIAPANVRVIVNR